MKELLALLMTWPETSENSLKVEREYVLTKIDFAVKDLTDVDEMEEK